MRLRRRRDRDGHESRQAHRRSEEEEESGRSSVASNNQRASSSSSRIDAARRRRGRRRAVGHRPRQAPAQGLQERDADSARRRCGGPSRRDPPRDDRVPVGAPARPRFAARGFQAVPRAQGRSLGDGPRRAAAVLRAVPARRRGLRRARAIGLLARGRRDGRRRGAAVFGARPRGDGAPRDGRDADEPVLRQGHQSATRPTVGELDVGRQTPGRGREDATRVRGSRRRAVRRPSRDRRRQRLAQHGRARRRGPHRQGAGGAHAHGVRAVPRHHQRRDARPQATRLDARLCRPRRAAEGQPVVEPHDARRHGAVPGPRSRRRRRRRRRRRGHRARLRRRAAGSSRWRGGGGGPQSLGGARRLGRRPRDDAPRDGAQRRRRHRRRLRRVCSRDDCGGAFEKRGGVVVVGRPLRRGPGARAGGRVGRRGDRARRGLRGQRRLDGTTHRHDRRSEDRHRPRRQRRAPRRRSPRRPLARVGGDVLRDGTAPKKRGVRRRRAPRPRDARAAHLQNAVHALARRRTTPDAAAAGRHPTVRRVERRPRDGRRLRRRGARGVGRRGVGPRVPCRHARRVPGPRLRRRLLVRRRLRLRQRLGRDDPLRRGRPRAVRRLSTARHHHRHKDLLARRVQRVPAPRAARVGARERRAAARHRAAAVRPQRLGQVREPLDDRTHPARLALGAAPRHGRRRSGRLGRPRRGPRALSRRDGRATRARARPRAPALRQ
mmetsp:Transcript_630/g.2490  ORF Transcript_630/g.2490 Transcript_630/m.2490 type:complete len:720 (-) Transcript_630:1532-3691(-)